MTLLIVLALTAALASASTLDAVPLRAALIIENIAGKGVDTLLYNTLTQDLGYEVRWITPDSVAIRNPDYFDTAFAVVIWCGSEVVAPSPSTVADTIAKSRVGFVSLSSDTWDEINLGVNSNGTNGRTVENSGFVRATNREHWITRPLQDTLYLWTATSLGIYGLAFPDSAHEVIPLIIDKDEAADTAHAHLCVADSGATIINTGDGNNIARGRRAFLGLFSVTTTPRDSCQFFTIFNRVVAWTARDTANQYITQHACFSGKSEIEDAWAEASSGLDSLESYGGWGSLYTGHDFDDKVAFMKINNGALNRKAPPTIGSVTSWQIRTRLYSVANNLDDSLWESTNGIQLLKLDWRCGNATGQSNTEFVNWVHRYIAEADTFRWNVGGAFGANSDVVDTVMDSVRQNRDNAIAGAFFTWSIPPQFAVRMIRGTTANHGWVWHNYWNNQSGQINDAEIIYHSSEANAVADRPLITVVFSHTSAEIARRRYPTLGLGLLGDNR